MLAKSHRQTTKLFTLNSVVFCILRSSSSLSASLFLFLFSASAILNSSQRSYVSRVRPISPAHQTMGLRRSSPENTKKTKTIQGIIGIVSYLVVV